MTVTEGPRCGQDHMTRSYDPVISVTVMPTLPLSTLNRLRFSTWEQWSSLAGFGGYKQKPDPTAGDPGYPMGPMSILGIPSRAEAFGTSISRIVCTNKLSDFQGEGMKMLNCLIYLDGREASFLLQGLEVCRAKSRAAAVVNAAESFSYSSPRCQIAEDLVNARSLS